MPRQTVQTPLGQNPSFGVRFSAAALTAVDSIDTVTSGAGTIVGSLYTTGYAGHTVCGFKASDGSADSWRFNIESTTGYPFLWSVNTSASGTTLYKPTTPVPLNQWFRYVVIQTISGGNVTGKLYINGRKIAEQTSTRDVAACSRFTVRESSLNTNSRIGVYDRELTDKEILDDFKNPLSVPGAKMKFLTNEGCANTLYDSSGNGFDLTGGTVAAWRTLPDIGYNRSKVAGNLVWNGDFSMKPLVSVPHTAAAWVDGTAGGAGSTTVPANPLKMYVHRTGTVEAQLVEENGYDCVKISTLASGSYVEFRLGSNSYYGDALGGYKMNIKPSTQYKLSYWMKTNYISGDSNDGAYVVFGQGSGTFAGVTSTFISKVKTTTDWTYYESTFTTNASTRFGAVQCRIYGHTGAATLLMDAWFRDVRLEEL